MTTIGASRSSELAMSVIGAAPLAARSMPGRRATSADPGENPSLRLSSVGSMWTPAALAGVASGPRSTRRPVSVERSRDGEVVVRERQQAPGAAQRIAALGVGRQVHLDRAGVRIATIGTAGAGPSPAERRCRRHGPLAATSPAVSATSASARSAPPASDDHR